MIAPALLASTAIILLSFVSEDAATISSALSIFGGPLSWPLGFASCFAGIWIGDLALYSLARGFGKPILRSRWIARFADSAAIKDCEEKFNRRGSLALLASRFVPGTRLVTYLTAGLLSMPAGRFALVTAVAALSWIAAIFALTGLLGSHALVRFIGFQGKIGLAIVTSLLLATALLVFRKVVPAVVPDVIVRNPRSALQPPAFLRRWKHWEFWPAWLFYIPVALFYIYLAIRYRSFTLPTAANPGMSTGGFVGESKIDILNQLRGVDVDLVADAYLLEGGTITDRLLSLNRLCGDHGIRAPFILKPDIGQRGNGVCLIHSLAEAFQYLQEMNGPVILQRYAAGRHEAGVFYFRFPGQSRGQIFSITEKIFPTIIGDGVSTIEQLIRADSRAVLIASTYLRRFAARKDEVLLEGKVLKLVETGNHAQGCIFGDGARLWSDELERRIDNFSRQLPEFYFGRFDIRYDNEREFCAGRNFKIVELNGSSSEATSIYDARTSLRSAYKLLFRQWRLAFEIGAANQARGNPPSSLLVLWTAWRYYSKLALSYPDAS